MPKIKILLEDTYGRLFFRELIHRLKQERIFPRGLGVSVKRLPIFCNSKISRELTQSLLNDDILGIVLLLDGDGNKIIKRGDAIKHVPRAFPLEFEVYLFEYEVEDLILFCENIPINSKSSETLKTKRKYSKNQLPSYAKSLDLVKVSEHPVIAGLINFANSVFLG